MPAAAAFAFGFVIGIIATLGFVAYMEESGRVAEEYLQSCIERTRWRKNRPK